mmetsp:Transcript_96929/g.196917  ORF Transcript_96929/g.196917 Transcript_96929/m.196917 type:complete len:432 (-) Transcript_96929:89-1384(-)
MSLKSRRSNDPFLLLARRHTTNELFRVLFWAIVFFSLLVNGVCAASNNTNSTSNSNNNSNNNITYFDAEEEERIRELIEDEWYNLARYLIGLALCIFGLIGMYFHQFASYCFLKRYIRPRETERRIGRVVVCEPLLRCISVTEKRKKKRNLYHGDLRKTASGGEVAKTGSSCTTDYVREEDIHKDENVTGYRILVVYYVPKSSSAPFLCCNTNTENMNITIHCTNSFSVHSCASEVRDTGDIEDAIKTYRTRSLPATGSDRHSYNELNGKICNGMKLMYGQNNEIEYFKWYETSTAKPVDTPIDLILLKGHPTSACTPELIDSHLEQVGTTGKENKGVEEKYCKSISLMGLSLVVAMIILLLASVFVVLEMPNPDAQRPIGFTVVGVFFAVSTLCAYLCAKVLFEQYKQTTFFSAFTVPSTVPSNVVATDV